MRQLALDLALAVGIVILIVTLAVVFVEPAHAGEPTGGCWSGNAVALIALSFSWAAAAFGFFAASLFCVGGPS